MVAEAVAPEVELKQPEVAVDPTPEAANETVETPDNQQEDTSHIDAFLEGLGAEDTGTSAADGTGAETNGVAPPSESLTAPTEAEIRQKVEQEQAERQQANNLKAYREGVSRSFQSVESELSAKAREWNLDIDQADWLRQRFSQHNGHWKVLYDAAIEQASPQIKGLGWNEAHQDISNQLWKAVNDDLGEAAVKSVETANPKTWEDFAKALTKEARKGYVPQTDLRKAQEKVISKFAASLKDRGLDIKDFTGNGGSDLPPMRGGSGGIPTLAQYTSATFEQRMAWQKADPNIETKILQRAG